MEEEQADQQSIKVCGEDVEVDCSGAGQLHGDGHQGVEQEEAQGKTKKRQN